MVIIVGYDSTDGYLIGMNVWGTEWGEEGFFRIDDSVERNVCNIFSKQDNIFALTS